MFCGGHGAVCVKCSSARNGGKCDFWRGRISLWNINLIEILPVLQTPVLQTRDSRHGTVQAANGVKYGSTTYRPSTQIRWGHIAKHTFWFYLRVVWFTYWETALKRKDLIISLWKWKGHVLNVWLSRLMYARSIMPVSTEDHHDHCIIIKSIRLNTCESSNHGFHANNYVT